MQSIGVDINTSKFTLDDPIYGEVQVRHWNFVLLTDFLMWEVSPTLTPIKVKGRVPVLFLTEHHAMKAYWGV
jgi:hypothetical protein